jgi:hypothetical protein
MTNNERIDAALGGERISPTVRRLILAELSAMDAMLEIGGVELALAYQDHLIAFHENVNR